MVDYDERGERATRDIVVARDVSPRCGPGGPRRTAASTSRWAISGRRTCAKQFKGMVERCADCGFDLAGGLVEVVPTAHYLMGGVMCDVDTSTEMPGLYVAGEDAGGVHGANRLGGNGVANSTVFGGIAGETMAADIAKGLDWRTTHAHALRPRSRALSTVQRKAGRPQRLARAAARY